MVVAVVTATTPVALAQAPSSPPTTGACQFDQDICAGLGLPTSASPTLPAPGPSAIVRAPVRRRPSPVIPTYRWVRERVPIISPQSSPPPTSSCTDPVTDRPGFLYVERQVVVATGETVQSRTICVLNPVPPPPPNPTPTTPATVAVPIPPPQEIWDRVPLPTPTWGLNPVAEGLTGLPTQLWDPSGGAPVTATVDLGGFTATATAKPVRYEWKMWDRADQPNRNPSPLVEAQVPGSDENPAAVYTYETTGDFTLTMTVTWAGTYRFTGPGVDQVVDLGTTTTSGSRPYHVIEVRGTRR